MLERFLSTRKLLQHPDDHHFELFAKHEGATYIACTAFACQTSGLGSVHVAGQACGDLFLSLQHRRLCMSGDSHDHVNGGTISLALSGTLKDK